MRLSEVPSLATNPMGRWLLARGIMYRAWPVLRVLAGGWRRGPVRATRLVAVVGSFGKTTTAHAVAAAVGAGREMGIASNQFGFLAAKMLAIRPGQRRAVVEVGIDGPGQMAPYAALLRPQVAVVTAVGSEHRLSLGTLERTAQEKGKMVEAVPPDGAVVLNADDPAVADMAGRAAAPVTTFGFSPESDVRIVRYAVDWPRGNRLELDLRGKRVEVRSRLVGRHMALPTAAGLAVALAENVDLEPAVRGLEAVEPAPGRMQPVRLPGGGWCLRDDFKSAIETIDRALETLEEITAERKIVVLGDVSEAGQEQHRLHRDLGARVARVADMAVFVGNMAKDAAVGARRAGGAPGKFRASGTRVRDALGALEGVGGEGDLVLIKGRISQRLERVVLWLQGRVVRCNLKECKANNLRCERCGMLERGWPEDRR